MNTSKIITALATHGITANTRTVEKNGKLLTGVEIITDTGMNPIFYMYQLPESTEDALEMIKEHLFSLQSPIDTSVLSNYNQAKELLRLRVMPNTGAITTTVSRPYLDLLQYVAIELDAERSCKVNESILSHWEITVEQLFEQATNNMESLYVVKDLMSLITGILTYSSIDDFEYNDDIPMTVITTKNTTHGASAICNLSLLSRIAEELDDSLYILPSSIHEIIVVKASSACQSELSEMVMAVNAEQVAPEEQLSNHAYYFDRSTCRLSA